MFTVSTGVVIRTYTKYRPQHQRDLDDFGAFVWPQRLKDWGWGQESAFDVKTGELDPKETWGSVHIQTFCNLVNFFLLKAEFFVYELELFHKEQHRWPRGYLLLRSGTRDDFMLILWRHWPQAAAAGSTNQRSRQRIFNVQFSTKCPLCAGKIIWQNYILLVEYPASLGHQYQSPLILM